MKFDSITAHAHLKKMQNEVNRETQMTTSMIIFMYSFDLLCDMDIRHQDLNKVNYFTGHHLYLQPGSDLSIMLFSF